jgi:hypothetical protein
MVVGVESEGMGVLKPGRWSSGGKLEMCSEFVVQRQCHVLGGPQVVLTK